MHSNTGVPYMQMADKNSEQPYKPLGSRLRGMRERLCESIAEVSGAVEIDTETLAKFELGADRPTEDILLLLISHFAVKEDEADKLWELAGYEQHDTGSFHMTSDELGNLKNTVLVMPFDVRITYTDMAHVMVNDHGVVMNFMQSAGPNGQPLVVSRMGMSREHAQSLIDLLQKTLSAQAQPPKALPAPETTDADSKKSDIS